MVLDARVFFPAIEYGDAGSTYKLFAVESDGDVVVAWHVPGAVVEPGTDRQTNASIALNQLETVILNDALYFAWSETRFEENFYAGSDFQLGRINADGTVDGSVAEVTEVEFRGHPARIPHSMEAVGDAIYLPLKPQDDNIGQIFRIEPGAIGPVETGVETEVTAFARPGARGAWGEVTAFAGEVYFTADIQSPLDRGDEIWRLRADGDTELVLDSEFGRIADMEVWNGSLWIALYRNGAPELYRVDGAGAQAQEVPLPAGRTDQVNSVAGFELLDDGLHIVADGGLRRVGADGSIGPNLVPTLDYIIDVAEYGGETYLAAWGLGLASQLFRLGDDGTVSLAFRVDPVWTEGFIETLHPGADGLYFTGNVWGDDGYGGREQKGAQMFRLDEGGAVTMLTDPDRFYSVGTPLPFTTSAPQADRGTDAPEALNGTAGDDTIFGLGGGDWITPGAGSDSVDGGDGVDMISFVDLGQRVAVSLSGGEATSGDDTNRIANVENITGSIYSDLIEGDAGDNYLRGMGGYDWFIGSDGADSYEGSNGRDMISYVFATERVGIDLEQQKGLFGQAGGDVYDSIERATGSSWADLFYGSGGEDEMRGMGGYDWFMSSGGGRDRYDGGSGRDTVSYAFAGEGVTASLSLGYGSRGEAARDLYTSIENLTGTNFDDILTGDNERNILRGQYGRDILYGNGGTDYLTGGGSDDVLYGGDGWDVAVFEHDRSDYRVFTAGNLTSVTYLPGGGEGVDLVLEVEALSFADGFVYL